VKHIKFTGTINILLRIVLYLDDYRQRGPEQSWIGSGIEDSGRRLERLEEARQITRHRKVIPEENKVRNRGVEQNKQCIFLGGSLNAMNTCIYIRRWLSLQ
jgi:hypothetical protein